MQIIFIAQLIIWAQKAASVNGEDGGYKSAPAAQTAIKMGMFIGRAHDIIKVEVLQEN